MWRDQQGAEHEKALEEVGPANGAESAHERISHNDRGSDIHGDRRVYADHCIEQRAAGFDAGGGINRVGNKENDRAEDLKDFA